jgi:hypothetical protein
MRNKILDEILALLMSFEIPIFGDMLDNINPKNIDMDFISETLSKYEWDNWMKKSFQDELLHKNYIELDNKGDLCITEIGKEFKRKGGYSQIDKIVNQENIIREKTIEKFKYDKFAFWLSIIAIGISLASFFLNSK